MLHEEVFYFISPSFYSDAQPHSKFGYMGTTSKNSKTVRSLLSDRKWPRCITLATISAGTYGTAENNASQRPAGAAALMYKPSSLRLSLDLCCIN